MDPLSEVIALLEPQSYRVGGFVAGGAWSIRFGEHRGIKCYAVTAGAAWLVLESETDPILLGAGDCFVLPRGLPFRLASDPALPPDDWHRHLAAKHDGALAQLGDGGDTTVLGGYFLLGGPQAEMLLGALPPVIHLRSPSDREALRWSFERMREELAGARPGSALIAQQLAYMILVQALRLHLEADGRPGWLSALADRHVGAAIAALHREPARGWTVGALAAEVGMSRSSFAARFGRLVGDGPIEYLARWRMALATRRLARGEPVGTVARALGYQSESAFSTAYKRITGRPPRRRPSQPQPHADQPHALAS